MAAIAVSPYILKDCLFTVEADSYEAHVSQVEFTPSAPTATWKGLTPDASFSFVGTATWMCNLTFAQDWSTADSLSRYLFENEGDEIDVVFEPVAAGPSISATLMATPGSVGGSVDSVATSTVTLTVKGKPTLEALGA